MTSLVGRGQLQIPPVEAVLAAIGDHVAGEPRAVLARVGEQEAASTAVDAYDFRFGRNGGRHVSSLPVDDCIYVG